VKYLSAGSDLLSLTGGKTGIYALVAILSGLSWGFGYTGQPHLLARFIAIRNTTEIKRGRIIAFSWAVPAFSGAFFMLLENKNFGDYGMMVFADCAVHPNPTAEELAQIAVSTAYTTKAIANMQPRVALLSFSTKGSAKHEMVDKVVEATALAQKMAPQFQFDGELQADAAIIPAIGSKKAPDSTIAGYANVLVFPTLEVGNIAYKLVERLAGAQAVGPVLQGMAAPINDLSRGCSVDDIINMVAITSLQAAGKKA